MKPHELPEFKSRLRETLVLGDITEVFSALKSGLQSEKQNVVLVLQNQYNTLKLMELQNRISFEQLQVQQAGITANLLSLIDMIEPEDFEKTGGTTVSRKTKTGSVLYAIPALMGVKQEQQCIVRLAFDEQYLLENVFANSDTHIRSLRRIDDRMEVEIVDPSENGVFAIRTISSTMQKVEQDDYTEWLFYVKPLAAGKFPLFLKVSIILMEEGERVRKELVLQEVIEVVTQLPATEVSAGSAFRQSGLLFTIGLPELAPMDDQISEQPKPSSPNLLRRVATYATAVVTIAALGWWLMTPKGNSPLAEQVATNEIEMLEASTAIEAPFQKVNVAPIVCTIPANVDTVITLANGTSIEIPAGVFVTNNNQPVLEPVEIRFREFQQAAEVISSGIPMEAVPGHGSDDIFETAGMFEIKGYAKGESIKIAKGKTITVNLQSNVNGDYDFWKYDPKTSAWVNQAPGNTVNVQPFKLAPKPEREKDRLPNLSLQAPTPPANIETDPRQPLQFKGLAMDLSKCPDLRKKNTQIILLYAGKNPKTTEATVLKQIGGFRWRKSELKPTADPNLYTLTLEGDTTLRLPVTLALSGKEFQSKQKAYEDLVAESKRETEMQRYNRGIAEQQEAVTRGMQIDGFGLYNHDRYYNRQDMLAVVADFDFGEPLSPEVRAQLKVYLIAGNDRAIMSYPSSTWTSFRFSPTDRNSLLAVLPDGRVATFGQRDFQQAQNALMQARGQRFLFKMKLQPKPVTSVDELQQTIQRMAI